MSVLQPLSKERLVVILQLPKGISLERGGFLWLEGPYTLGNLYVIEDCGRIADNLKFIGKSDIWGRGWVGCGELRC